ncbi:N-acyltransferase YncA [Arthrobacter saudimassiliensis]|uniref:N-acyltransferase YncA n=1 Tax=Arthrobacter saudimassiliensis TaxID=1461584 RepID=A0A078MRC4_9MICC|nr:N-acyltransferase YncA [Arthrobacter saudimassiliensis]
MSGAAHPQPDTLQVRRAVDGDWPGIWAVMEPIVRAGQTYCWDRDMDEGTARDEWMEPAPAAVYVAVDGDGTVVGTALLHPNRSGPGDHVANASFMTHAAHGGRGIARRLAGHVLAEARAQGYTAMQFNAVVEANRRAVALWQSLGFRILATVPEAFRHPTEGLTGLHIMYRALEPEAADPGE